MRTQQTKETLLVIKTTDFKNKQSWFMQVVWFAKYSTVDMFKVPMVRFTICY